MRDGLDWPLLHRQYRGANPGCGGGGSAFYLCLISAFVQGVDDTSGDRPHGEGPCWRGTGLQVPHVETGLQEATRLLLVPTVTRPVQPFLAGTPPPQGGHPDFRDRIRGQTAGAVNPATWCVTVYSLLDDPSVSGWPCPLLQAAGVSSLHLSRCRLLLKAMGRRPLMAV